MKKRATSPKANHSPEFKGVVKKITGRLTSNPQLEQEGRKEMLGQKPKARRGSANPDPFRRG